MPDKLGPADCRSDFRSCRDIGRRVDRIFDCARASSRRSRAIDCLGGRVGESDRATREALDSATNILRFAAEAVAGPIW